MKNIILAVTVALAIFASTGAFARGFSVGVLGSYAIDGGEIEKSIDLSSAQTNLGWGSIESDKIIIPGAAVFLRYDFKNNLFLRTGAEFYKLLSGDTVERGDTNTGDFYKFRYDAIAYPLYMGINTSPDRGKTNIYGAAGIVFANISIERDEKHYMAGNLTHFWTEKDKMIFGYTGIFGIDKKIFGNIYFTIEYAAYLCEEYSDESGEGYDHGAMMPLYYQYTERYGLPKQQLRVGLKYDF